jgi:hypothetical protein
VVSHPLSESLPPHPSPTPAFVGRHDSEGKGEYEYCINPNHWRLALSISLVRLHLPLFLPYLRYSNIGLSTASSDNSNHRCIAHTHTYRSLVTARFARRSDESPRTCPVHVDSCFPHVQPKRPDPFCLAFSAPSTRTRAQSLITLRSRSLHPNPAVRGARGPRMTRWKRRR